MPPEVVGEVLRSAVRLPGAAHRKVFVIQHEDSAWPFAFGAADGVDVDAVWPAVGSVRAAVARLARDLFGLNHLYERGVAWVWRGVQDVDAGRAQTGHDQVAALDMRVGRGRAQRRAAGVPAEMVKLIAGVRHLGPAKHPAIGGGGGIDVEGAERI